MKKIVLGAIIATMLVVSTGCSKSKDVDSSTSAFKETKVEVSTIDSSNTSQNNEEGSYKDESIEVLGTSEEVRVVASSVAVVNILDKLGVPMVGVPTSAYTLPDSVEDATRIGNPMSPDMEVIKSLEPTILISVDSMSGELKTQFESLEIPATFVNLSSYQGLKDSISTLGTVFGKEVEANAMLAEFETKEAEVAKAIDGKEAPNVLIIFGVSGQFMTATESTYVGDLVKTVGAKNIMEDTKGAFVPVDMEYLASKNPDYILLMVHANVEETLASFEKEFETNKAWNNFTAVKEGNVIGLEPGVFGTSANLQAPDALLELIDILYAK